MRFAAESIQSVESIQWEYGNWEPIHQGKLVWFIERVGIMSVTRNPIQQTVVKFIYTNHKLTDLDVIVLRPTTLLISC